MKKLLIALALLWCSPALAQNTLCATRPLGDSSNACASTAFVQGTVSSGLPLANGDLFVGNASNLAVAQALTGDCTISNAGVITCTKTGGVAFGPFATSSTGANLTSGTVANAALANMAAATMKCRETGNGTGAPQDCLYPIINVTDAPYNADPTGSVDATSAIQSAINALPVSGGVVHLACGTYKTNTGNVVIKLGNGTSSSASTRYGIVLQGDAPPSSPLFPGFATQPCVKFAFAGTTGDMVLVAGPLQGWSIQNIWFDCNNVAGSQGLHVTSAQFGDSANIVINNCFRGFVSDTLATFGSLTNTNSWYNFYRNLNIQTSNSISNVIGAILSGVGLNSNTSKNSFYNFSCSLPNTGANAGTCLQLQATDSNNFFDATFFTNSVNNTGVLFDYSIVGNFPASTTFYTVDNEGATGTAWNNNGSPGAGATPNYIYGLVETNGQVAPNLPNLAVYGSHNINLNQGGNNPNLRLVSTGGHLGFIGTAPTISGDCNGAGSGITGTDNAGLINSQTAATAKCTLTFAKAYANQPFCTAAGVNVTVSQVISSVTTLVINFNSTGGAFLTYMCFGS